VAGHDVVEQIEAAERHRRGPGAARP
jgi:hypothetical protein